MLTTFDKSETVCETCHVKGSPAPYVGFTGKDGDVFRLFFFCEPCLVKKFLQ